MKRRQWFEFEDQSWLSPALRDMVTEFLQRTLILRAGVYLPVVPMLEEMLEYQNTDQVVDLCSGASGPWAQLYERLRQGGREISLTLTDKYPNARPIRGVEDIPGTAIRYESNPVDATDVPGDLAGVRTMFTSFHHFPPEIGREILRNAVDNQVPICIFEFTERRWKTVLGTLVVAPVMLAAWALLGRPRSARKLFWTFVVPILPLVVTWDGMVSNLRTYLAGELETLATALHDETYVWKAGQLKARETKIPITYLIGYPGAGERQTRAEPKGARHGSPVSP